jgi:hypothetical protein
MPANPKYLSSPRQRALKISAGVLGGFILALALQLAIGAYLDNKGSMVITSAFLTFFLWVGLMAGAFLFRNGWHAWGIYLLGILACSGLIYLGL